MTVYALTFNAVAVNGVLHPINRHNHNLDNVTTCSHEYTLEERSSFDTCTSLPGLIFHRPYLRIKGSSADVVWSTLVTLKAFVQHITARLASCKSCGDVRPKGEVQAAKFCGGCLSMLPLYHRCGARKILR